MNFEDYEQSAMKIAEYPRDAIHLALGLNVEAGEVSEKVK